MAPGSLECDFSKSTLLRPVQYIKGKNKTRYLFFLFREIWTIIVSTSSVNIAEGDLIVAEDLVLVALVHHQVVCHGCQASHNLQPRRSPLARRTEVCNRTPELQTRKRLALTWK